MILNTILRCDKYGLRQINEISLARVLSVSLVRKFQAVNASNTDMPFNNEIWFKEKMINEQKI